MACAHKFYSFLINHRSSYCISFPLSLAQQKIASEIVVFTFPQSDKSQATPESQKKLPCTERHLNYSAKSSRRKERNDLFVEL